MKTIEDDHSTAVLVKPGKSGTAEAAVMSSVNQGTGFGMFVKDGKFLYKLYTSSGETTRVDGPTAWAKQPVSMHEKAQERAHCCVAFLGIGVYVGAEALFLAFFLLLRLWLDSWLLHWRWP